MTYNILVSNVNIVPRIDFIPLYQQKDTLLGVLL